MIRKVKISDHLTYYYYNDKKIGKCVDGCYYFFYKDDNSLYVGWKEWLPEIVYTECGYEDCHGRIHISLFGWHSVFMLPFKSKRYPDGDCCPPEWGISVHGDSIWLYYGGGGNFDGGTRYKCWDLPFFTRNNIRWDVMCKDGKMHNRHKLDRHSSLYENPFVDTKEYEYTDRYDNSKVPCVYWVEEMEWRPKWLSWCSLFKDVHRYLNVNFSVEVGSGKDTWKGGVVGCSFEMRKDETPEECIKRMEIEKNF